MAEKEIISRVQNKHDVEANWINFRSTFVPMAGELIIYDREDLEVDGNLPPLPSNRTTRYTHVRYKIGDGVTTIGNLPFFSRDYNDLLNKPTISDTQVTNTLAKTTKAYITGTTSATTNTGTQVFDTGVYLGTTSGTLVATKFDGTATKATKDSNGNTITSTYETKTDAARKLASIVVDGTFLSDIGTPSQGIMYRVASGSYINSLQILEMLPFEQITSIGWDDPLIIGWYEGGTILYSASSGDMTESLSLECSPYGDPQYVYYPAWGDVQSGSAPGIYLGGNGREMMGIDFKMFLQGLGGFDFDPSHITISNDYGNGEENFVILRLSPVTTQAYVGREVQKRLSWKAM